MVRVIYTIWVPSVFAFGLFISVHINSMDWLFDPLKSMFVYVTGQCITPSTPFSWLSSVQKLLNSRVFPVAPGCDLFYNLVTPIALSLLIVISAILFSRFKSFRHEQYFHDSLYYLGFLFTLSGLGLSLFYFATYLINGSDSGDENIVLIARMLTTTAMALLTTITGVLCRLIVRGLYPTEAKAKSDEYDVERKLNKNDQKQITQTPVIFAPFSFSGNTTTQSLIDKISSVDITRESSENDDLTKINGIGKPTQKKLNKLGVYLFSHIAEWTEKSIKHFDKKINSGKYNKQDWVRDAKDFDETKVKNKPR